MTREEAIEVVKKNWPDSKYTSLWEALETLIPELHESEDERIRKELVAFFIEVRNREGNEGYWHDLKVADILAYLEKQKEQKPVEWSEEDKEHLESVMHRTEVYVGRNLFGKIKEDFEWLKELPNRFQLQPKQEWSEEDEKMLTGIIERGSVQVPPYTTALREEQIEWLMNRLKSLLPSWKPSEEQIEAVRVGSVIATFENPWAKEKLAELYEQLKKL